MAETRHPVLERLARGQSIVTDGSVSDELVRRGYRPVSPLHDAAAAREAPELLTAVHRAYVDAGAEVLTAHTARTTVRALARAGLGMRAAALTHLAVDLALEAAQHSARPVAVAGALGPLEDFNRPDATPSPRTLADEHGEHSVRLASTGCNIILVQAMPTVRETLAATAAARRAISTVWTTLLVPPRRAPGSAALGEAAVQAVAVGAQAIVLQGSSMPELLDAFDELFCLTLGVPVGLRPVVDPSAPSTERFATELSQAVQQGARIVGGARGTTPEHIRGLVTKVRARAAA